MLGKGSVSHNSRKFHAANTDPERSQLNRCYCNTPIQQVYHELFDEALERFNAKQARSDRRIDDYYEKIRSGKQEKPFHEIILQIGNKDDTNAMTSDGEQAAAMLEEFYKDFQQRNPNLHIFSAHLHMDEATPHLHIDFVPHTTGSKRGLDTRVSLKQALAAQGFTGGSRSETEWNQWVQAEKEQLAEVMARHGIEWEQKGTHNEHLTVLDFKKQERTKEVAALEEKAVVAEQSIEEKQNVAIALKTEISQKERVLKEITGKKVKIKKIDEIAFKPTLFDSTKVVVDKAEFDEVRVLAKKQIVAESKEKALSAKNTELVSENRGLRSENTNLRNELYEYKSIKNQLSVKKLEVKVNQLQRFIDRIMEFIEKLGLKPQLDRFLKHDIGRDR